MSALHSRLVSLVLAPSFAAALVLLPVIDVRAATPITFGGSDGGGLMIGSPCINGRAGVSVPIHIVWKSASGATKARIDQATTLGGTWDFCSETKQLHVGDTIKAVAEGTSRTLTMINVSIGSDRRTEFHGRGPASLDGVVWYSAGIFADFQSSAAVTSDGNGRWSVVIPDGLTGGLYVGVDWQTPQGDYFTARMNTPYVKVTLGQANVEAGGPARARSTIKLRYPSDGSLRGKAAVVFDEWGTGNAQFVDTLGNPVAVRAGDRIVSALAPDLDWHVPDVSATADVANDLVIGICNATEISATDALARVFRAGQQRGVDLTRTDPDGSFTADFNGREVPFHKPADIRPGDTISVDCYYETGDIVSMSFQVQ